MQRVGLLLRVKPEKLEEYKREHTQVWPELQAELKAAGFRNYSLWLSPEGLEFGYLECDDWDAACAYLAKSEIHDRWQEYMSNFLDSPQNADQGGQPVQMLKQVFLLE